MNHTKQFLRALPFVFALAATQAAEPAGTVSQLSGWVMAVKPDGRARALSAQSKLEVGDTLVSEPASYVRLALADGNEVVMGPATTLKVDRLAADGTALGLVNGQLQVTGVPGAQSGRFTIAAGANSIDAGPASFLVAQGPVPPSASGGLAPGLYVHVIDGLIQLSNRGGVQQFAAGQFGYTASITQPPVIVPRNPGIQFTPPPTFSSSSAPAGSNTNAPKSNAVDCEVR